MTTKLCRKCNTTKSTTEFHKDRTSKDGLCFCCIECKKIYREKNKEILNKRSKEYQNKYKQDKEYYKKYYEKKQTKNIRENKKVSYRQ